jgi:hypothetical protein
MTTCFEFVTLNSAIDVASMPTGAACLMTDWPRTPRIANPSAPSIRRHANTPPVGSRWTRYVPGGTKISPPPASACAIAVRNAGASSVTPSPTAPSAVTSITEVPSAALTAAGSIT